MLILGIFIGIVLTLIVVISIYVRVNHLHMKWKNLFIGLTIIAVVAHLVYSFIGIATQPEYTKPNGNVCKGYKYGWKICSGDINAE